MKKITSEGIPKYKDSTVNPRESKDLPVNPRKNPKTTRTANKKVTGDFSFSTITNLIFF